MADEVVTKEELNAIKSVLQSWKAAGEKDPLLPSNASVGEEEKCDAFGLNDNGEVELRRGVLISDTLSVKDQPKEGE